jgi:hypothetical protein
MAKRITELRPLLTEDDLVSRWSGKITKTTLATWRSRDKGPKYIKVGRAVLYPQKEVERYETRAAR